MKNLYYHQKGDDPVDFEFGSIDELIEFLSNIDDNSDKKTVYLFTFDHDPSFLAVESFVFYDVLMFMDHTYDFEKIDKYYLFEFENFQVAYDMALSIRQYINENRIILN